MRPVKDRLVLKPVERKETRVGSLVLPDIAIGDHVIWQVVATGPEVKEVKPGDYVICPVHVLQEIHVAGQEYAVVKEDHIYAVLEESEVYGRHPAG